MTACFYHPVAIYITLSTRGDHFGYNPMMNRNRCVMRNSAELTCEMHSHACLLQTFMTCFHRKDKKITISSVLWLCMWHLTEKRISYLSPCSKWRFLLIPAFETWFFHLLHYRLLQCYSLSSFFLISTSFLSLCSSPIPHFLLVNLVWLWGLGCRDNRGHRLSSTLFVKFLLLHAYCTFAAGIGKRLSPPSPHPHLVRHMQAWMSSEKYKWDTKLFLESV